MMLLRFLLSLLTLWWAGLVVLASLNGIMKVRFKTLEALAFSWMAGMGIVSLQMFFYAVIGIRFNIPSLSCPWALLLIIFFSTGPLRQSILNFGVSDAPPAKESFLRSFNPILLIPAFQIITAFICASATPISGWDAWSIWFLKSRVFFLNQGIPQSFMGLSVNPHPDYPLLIPLCGTWIYTFLGEPNDTLVKIIYPAQYFSLILIFYY